MNYFRKGLANHFLLYLHYQQHQKIKIRHSFRNLSIQKMSEQKMPILEILKKKQFSKV